MALQLPNSQLVDSNPKLSYTNTIQVLVGKERKAFTVHRNLISKRAPFFKAAFSDRWLDSSLVVEMPTDDPDTFDIWLHCAYQDQVDPGNVYEHLPGDKTDGPGGRTIDRIAQAWILSDKLGDTCGANLLIDAIVWYSDAISTVPEPGTIALVAQTLPTDSPLYRLFVDIFVYETDAESARAILEDDQIPREFILQVLQDQTKLACWRMAMRKSKMYFPFLHHQSNLQVPPSRGGASTVLRRLRQEGC